MDFTAEDIDFFVNNIYDNSFSTNNGGMSSPDMFTLFYALKTVKPKVVIESGVWNGLSTKLIRKTLGTEAIIICLDPRDLPSNGYRDNNSNTIYCLGKNFIDFDSLNLDQYDAKTIFAFFDCHQNAPLRLLQCKKKNIIHCLFNDNYPEKLGGHFTFQHLFNNDNRYNKPKIDKKQIIDLLEVYCLFPNIFPSIIQTGEGIVQSNGFFSNNDIIAQQKYPMLKKDAPKYRWNTYIKIK